ncbi:thioredoxin domain-containing protein [bacterium]|nr:thioredoxin domain-containing protein [bacterium]
MDKVLKKKIWIAIVALIGLITTIKLAVIYYEANFNPSYLGSFCSVNDFIDCDGVAQTSESQFFGVPLALWGLILYSFIFLMLIANKMKNLKIFKFMEVFKNPLDYIVSIGLISFCISMILLCVSLFGINKLCILCAVTYILDLIISLIAVDFKNGGFVKSIKQSFVDFLDALKIKPYLIAFIIVALAAIGALSYTTSTMVLAPQVKKQEGMAEFLNTSHNRYKIRGNVLGSKNPKLVVVTYTDYECPVCASYNIMIHKLAKEVKDIQIEHHNYPIDMACNPAITKPFHQRACMLAKYAMAAEKQDNVWGFGSALFEKKPKTEDEVLEIAKKLHFDVEQLKKDAYSEEISKKLDMEIKDANKKGIIGTPVTQVGYEIHIGITEYPEFKKYIQEKLKQAESEQK